MTEHIFVDAYDTPLGDGMLYLEKDETDAEKIRVVMTKGWMIKDLQTSYMIETPSRELQPLTANRAKGFYPADTEALRMGLDLGKIRLVGKELSWLEEKVVNRGDPLIRLIKKRRKHKPHSP